MHYYAKTFLQGTSVNVFNGCTAGGEDSIWNLMADFEMPSDSDVPVLRVKSKCITVHQQHCTLGPVPAGDNPQCSINFTDSIGEPNHAVKESTTYLPNAEGRTATTSTIASPCRQHLTSQRLPLTRSRSSSCPLPSSP